MSTSSPNCPACGSDECADVFELDDVPVAVGALWPSREAAAEAPTGDIRLSNCRHCDFVFNRAFDEALVTYAPGYEVSLNYSPTYRDFLDEVATRLIENFQVRRKSVVEIGCGNGYFLTRVCQLGDNRGTGFDPSIETERREQVGRQEIRLVRDAYSQRYADVEADLVCCRQVLEHMNQPRAFLDMVRGVIGPRHHAGVYFEVPNADHAFGKEVPWTIFYEHCNYFNAKSLTALFERCRFEVRSAGPCYIDGQYLYVEATPASSADRDARPPKQVQGALKERVADFSRDYRRRVRSWGEVLEGLDRAGRRVAAWGAGARAISFFNALQVRDQVPYVVDINPDRQGKYLPGTAQEVVTPERLREYRPDTVILTNPTYEAEIRQAVGELGLRCEFLSA